jgi:pimeloyl-ACP methyl ester carboxylesterase
VGSDVPRTAISRWADVDGPVHWLDYGGPADGPLIVCAHGLGGSALNWAAIAPELAETHRVAAIDLAGFGRTRGGAHSTTVQANQRLLHRFLTEHVGSPAILIGNSMGGLISILQASKRPDTVAGLVLVDPALPLPTWPPPDPRVFAAFASFLVPAVGRRVLARRRESASAQEAVLSLLDLCCADASRVPADVVAAHVDLAEERREYVDVDSELMTAAQSLLFVLADRRGYAQMQRSIDVPVLLLHGDKDRLVSLESARQAAAANPSWQFEVAYGVGHVPQLEVPQWTLAKIGGWLADHPEVRSIAARAKPLVNPAR